MQKEVRGDVVKNINEKRAGIRTGKLYAIDTSFCDNQLRVMMFETNKMYVLLEELKSYISDFRLKIPDITEESFACGAYLLLCTALKHFYAVTLLAQQWHYSWVMTLLRTIDEALMQCNLFANNAMKNDKTFLEKWFAGEIVKHSTTRKELNEYLPGFDTLTAYVYQMESQVSHNSYLSVLENISPVTQDFDFDWPTWFYRGNSAVRMAFRELSYMIIVLRGVYIMILRDPSKEAWLLNLMSKYGIDTQSDNESSQEI